MRPQIVEHRLQDQLLYPLDSVPLTPTTGPSTMALFIALRGLLRTGGSSGAHSARNDRIYS